MTVELSEQLRRFADLADPITMDELKKIDTKQSPSPWVSIRQPVVSHRDRLLVAAAVVVLVGSATALVVSLVTSSTTPPVSGPLTLGPSAMRLVADSTATALSSGTAHMVVTETQDGTVIDRWNVDVTFSGANVDENLLWTSWEPPSPVGVPGSPSTSSSDLREVDGTAYRLLNGQWSEESGPNASRFLTFPDPRTLVGKISPSADLRSLGTGTVDGMNVTHYQARNPSVLGNLGIAGLSGNGDTSFDVWVDGQNVVQRMAFESTGRSGACVSTVTPSSTPPTCVWHTMGSSADITFSHVGDPETITAPSNAVPGSWPTND